MLYPIKSRLLPAIFHGEKQPCFHFSTATPREAHYEQNDLPSARKPLATAILLAAVGGVPAHAATITVDTFDDLIDDAIQNCSLREAVISVTAGADNHGCEADVTEAYGTNDTIMLPAGTYALSIEGSDETVDPNGDPDGIDPNIEPLVDNVPDPTIGDLDIGVSMTIMGAGANTTTIQWDAGAVTPDRIFHVYSPDPVTVDATIQGVTLTGGETQDTFIKTGPVSGSGPDPTEYRIRHAGGAIAAGPAAAVVLVDPNITGDENSAGRGGSQRPTDPDLAATLSLTLTDVVVDTNTAGGDGGGIYTAAPMTATNVVVSNNTAVTNGGGIYNEGNSTVTDATISGNEAEGGGGMFLTGSNTIAIDGSTLNGNRAIGGGAISSRSSVTVNMLNSTISTNLAEDVGAGFYSNGTALLRFVTIAGNVSGSDSATAGAGINTFSSTGNPEVTVKNVLLAANLKGWDAVTNPDGPPDLGVLVDANCGRTGAGVPHITSTGNNLSSDATCGTVLSLGTDINNVDPLIGPLADNGGATQTHALLAGSPARGAGAEEAGVTVDQRDVVRETPPDIGAYEARSSGGGGGCSIGNSDPLLPAFLLAALAAIGLRRRQSR